VTQQSRPKSLSLLNREAADQYQRINTVAQHSNLKGGENKRPILAAAINLASRQLTAGEVYTRSRMAAGEAIGCSLVTLRVVGFV
jgi:hypothetical protein